MNPGTHPRLQPSSQDIIYTAQLYSTSVQQNCTVFLKFYRIQSTYILEVHFLHRNLELENGQ